MPNSIIAVSFKRNDHLRHIELFEISWVKTTAVKQNPYSIGCTPYYEAKLSNGEFIKISCYEISSALPEGSGQLKLDIASEKIRHLSTICEESEDSIRRCPLAYEYKKWIKEKLGVEIKPRPGWNFFTRQGIEITPSLDNQENQLKEKKWWSKILGL